MFWHSGYGDVFVFIMFCDSYSYCIVKVWGGLILTETFTMCLFTACRLASYLSCFISIYESKIVIVDSMEALASSSISPFQKGSTPHGY